jgi:hypothetical protein
MKTSRVKNSSLGNSTLAMAQASSHSSPSVRLMASSAPKGAPKNCIFGTAASFVLLAVIAAPISVTIVTWPKYTHVDKVLNRTQREHVIDAELQILKRLYLAFGGDRWRNNSGWRFDGVTGP